MYMRCQSPSAMSATVAAPCISNMTGLNSTLLRVPFSKNIGAVSEIFFFLLLGTNYKELKMRAAISTCFFFFAQRHAVCLLVCVSHPLTPCSSLWLFGASFRMMCILGSFRCNEVGYLQVCCARHFSFPFFFLGTGQLTIYADCDRTLHLKANLPSCLG